jgi:formylmethanofuran--tetrahydromethanopterin N-formyltransferase
VVDGISEAAVGEAMLAAMHATSGDGVLAISAGNYGGKLGKFHFHLRQLLDLDHPKNVSKASEEI